MDSESFLAAFKPVLIRLQSLCDSDKEFRMCVKKLGETLLEITLSVDEFIDQSPDAPSEVPEELESTTPAAPSEPLPVLTLGLSVPRSESDYTSYRLSSSSFSNDDLQLVESRCRLKAKGIRWFIQRNSLLNSGANFALEIEPIDREMISEAKQLPDCFLWMCHSSGPTLSNPALFVDVAGCFDNLADLISLFQKTEEDPIISETETEKILDLLSEAQSALRVGIDLIDGPNDFDQNWTYAWLKNVASERQIFIQRHLRASDPADPSAWPDMEMRIGELSTRIDQAARSKKLIQKTVGKIRYKASQLASNPVAFRDEWEVIIQLTNELLAEGIPPSNRELREALVPAIDFLPEEIEIPNGFSLVLREIDRYLGSVPARENTSVPSLTAEAATVAKLLRKKSLVLIGGELRGSARQALKDTFELNSVIWVSTREHESISGFESYIARPEVAIVLLAIRWSSHSFGEVLKFCEKYGKPLIRLPGGYNPNQVAAQIMMQASDRLRPDAD